MYSGASTLTNTGHTRKHAMDGCPSGGHESSSSVEAATSNAPLLKEGSDLPVIPDSDESHQGGGTFHNPDEEVLETRRCGDERFSELDLGSARQTRS
jgi:hypothetical protein